MSPFTRSVSNPSRNNHRGAARDAFTVLELCVVIAVIAVLLAVLLPAVVAARSRARATACAAHLRQIGVAFHTYAADNDGRFPAARHAYTDPVTAESRVKRWFDFISPYIGATANQDGADGGAWYTGPLRGSVIWGCPAWDQDSLVGPGYAMNPYPMTTPAEPGLREIASGVLSWVFLESLPVDGHYALMTRWLTPKDRCLIYDSVGIDTALEGWPWWEPVGAPMPAYPDPEYFTPDFNRHGRLVGRNGPDTLSINVLFVDGHVDVRSARTTQYAMEFSPPLGP